MSITWCRAWPCRYTRFSPTWICGPCWRRVPWARRAGAPSATRCWRRWPRRCWPCLPGRGDCHGDLWHGAGLAGTQLNIPPLMLYAQIGDGGSDFGVAAALSLLLMARASPSWAWATRLPGGAVEALQSRAYLTQRDSKTWKRTERTRRCANSARFLDGAVGRTSMARGAICVPWASSGPAMAIRAPAKPYRVAARSRRPE